MRRGWSSRGRKGLRTAATTLALSVGLAAVPVTARAGALPLPSTLFAKKKPKKDGLTPAQAEERRVPVQQQGRQMVAGGELMAATILYDNAAQREGDPILFMDSADAYLAIAIAERDIAAAETAKLRAQVAQDILYFHLDDAADPDYRQVVSEDVSGLLARASVLIDKADDAIAEIEAENEAAVTPEAAPKRKKKGDGRGLRIAGAGLMGLGVAGVGVGVAGLVIGRINQQRVDDRAVYGTEFDGFDAKGRRGNLLAGVGLAVGGAALAVGVTLFIIGRKRGKSSGGTADESASSSTREPALALVPAGRGLALTGRF